MNVINWYLVNKLRRKKKMKITAHVHTKFETTFHPCHYHRFIMTSFLDVAVEWMQDLYIMTSFLDVAVE